MDEREQRLRERAYRIWEEEGRVEGAHDDHWRRAEMSEQEADEITQANQDAERAFASDKPKPGSAADIRPPSVASSD